MATDFLYSDLPVSVRLDSSGSFYEFGVILDDAFVVIAARKTGGIRDDIARAKDAVALAAASTTPPASVPPAETTPPPVTGTTTTTPPPADPSSTG